MLQKFSDADDDARGEEACLFSLILMLMLMLMLSFRCRITVVVGCCRYLRFCAAVVIGRRFVVAMSGLATV